MLFKKIELYKDSPFVVNTKIIENIIYDKTFKLIPIDEKSFRLIIEPISIFSLKSILAKVGLKALKEDDKVLYNNIHKYNEEITTAWFTFTVNKIHNIRKYDYSFNFTRKNELFDKYVGSLSVSQISDFASILTLRYLDNIPLRAKEILNTISDTFINQGIEQKTEVAQLTLGFIDSQLSTINTKLTNSEINLENYKVSHDVIDLKRKVSLATTKVAEYEAQLLELQTEINILSNLQQFINKNENLSGLTIGTINFADKNLAILVTNLNTLTKLKEELSIDYTEIHPEVQKLSKNISSVKRSIKQALKNSLSQLYQRRLDLGSMIQKYNKSLESLPSQEKELAQLSRPLKVNQKIYEYLLQQKAETAILKSSTISNARILDSAREAKLAIKPKRKLIVLVGMILGLIIGITIAFLRKYLISTIQSTQEVEKTTHLPVYGAVPFNRDKFSKNLFTESLRNIRTNLQFLPGNEKNKVISITSSVSGEGKTTITAALSEILAHGDKNIIMLDLDLRKASLHEKFELSNDIGMSNYLTSHNTLEEVTKETNTNGLKIITTGPSITNPSELILSSKFTELLEILKEKYDYIVIDTPPAGLVTDAVIIMNYSDISFTIVRINYTKKEFVKNINNLAKKYSSNKMAIIVNDTQINVKQTNNLGVSYTYNDRNAQYYNNG